MLSCPKACRKPSSADISVDGGTGTPSGSAGVSGNQLVIALHNIKGEKGDTVKTGTTYSSRGTTTHYSTSYNNLKQLTAGYCENCARKAFNAKEENWPKPGLAEWIAMLVCLALCAGGAWAFTRELSSPDRNSVFFVLGAIVALVGLVLFFVFLWVYISNLKDYKWHRAGNRNTFSSPSEEILSGIVVKYYQPNGVNRYSYVAYFDLTYVKVTSGNPLMF